MINSGHHRIRFLLFKMFESRLFKKSNVKSSYKEISTGDFITF